MNEYKIILKQIQKILGNSTTDNIQLNEICNDLFKSKWLGCCSIDTIQDKKGYQIINLDLSNGPGTHWIGSVNDGEQTIIYDSFGDLNQLPRNKYIRILNPKFTEDDKEQGLNESNCGQRCVAWLMVYDLLGKDVALTV